MIKKIVFIRYQKGLDVLVELWGSKLNNFEWIWCGESDLYNVELNKFSYLNYIKNFIL